ncbi:MAG: 3-hydroxyacyl-CoA dehydrogenase NAD-binding domain-containing protein [Bacteroidota bacterium]
MQIQLDDIKKVLIVGAGTLGSRIGLQCAISGYKVVMYDIDASSFERARKSNKRLLNWVTKQGWLNPKRHEEVLARIRWTMDPEDAARDVDFVSESVLERPDVKKKVWKEFGPLCPEHAILTTNTSYLLPSMFAEESGSPERFCAFHFHDVFQANVVDVMPHPNTADWIPPLLMQLGKKLHQIPVMIEKETPGYVFNKLFGATLMTAGKMLADGIASVEDVDRSWMGNFNMPIGPFGMMDEVGLDTVWHVATNFKQDAYAGFIALVKEYMDAGKLGIKSGEGFYTYPRPSYKDENFLK